MRANTFRRIAADRTALHASLPPNYFWAEDETRDELFSLDILVIGPSHTPYSDGLWRLHFDIPQDYPQQPPTANFRTPIFHPNVDAQTGSICVETLKRDWTSTLTLRDLLITISCLLIQPNPDSALNAEAGALIQDNYGLFARRARLLASIHAAIPVRLLQAAREAQERGQESVDPGCETVQVNKTSSGPEASTPIELMAPRRQRRPIRRPQRVVSRRSGGSPIAHALRRQRMQGVEQILTTPDHPQGSIEDLHKSLTSASMSDDQENAPLQTQPEQTESRPGTSTPKRPLGTPVPLGELIIESDSDGDVMEIEYPPSPRKSPRKRAAQPQPARWSDLSTRHATTLTHEPFMITPAASFEDSMPSKFALPACKGKERAYDTPAPQLAMHDSSVGEQSKLFEHCAPSLSDDGLWDRCGRDIHRWNRGDFDGQPFVSIATRW